MGKLLLSLPYGGSDTNAEKGLFKMNYIQQIIEQLSKMSEEQKNLWILSQAKLCEESKRQGFLQSLTGEKKIPYMPSQREIGEFCHKVENGDIYLEYETHYYEFDDDGRYIDDWKTWHNDPFKAMLYLDSIFKGCHDLLILDEYGMAADILDKVCKLEFEVVEASESDDYVEAEDGLFTLADAVSEGMLSRKLAEIGMDWVRAALGRANERDESVPVREVLDLLEYPICKSVHPHMLIDDELLAGKFPDELLVHMENILGEEIQEDERFFREKYANVNYSYEKIRIRERLIRKKEILLDIQLKCRKTKQRQTEHLPFAFQWKQINELFEVVRGEHVIKNQWEVDLIQKICGNLLEKDNYGEEDWELRKKVLLDLVSNRFYEKIGCREMMWELSERLCDRKEEFLVFADLLNQADRSEYERKAASLYHQYGREDKYISYLEAHLGKEGKIYAALVDCYHRQGNIDGARKVARQGLEQCKDDLTDLFIWLLADARRSKDTENYKKLYASAKRRRGADIKKIDKALESVW
mgnify:CR=1 FL=1